MGRNSGGDLFRLSANEERVFSSFPSHPTVELHWAHTKARSLDADFELQCTQPLFCLILPGTNSTGDDDGVKTFVRNTILPLKLPFQPRLIRNEIDKTEESSAAMDSYNGLSQPIVLFPIIVNPGRRYKWA